ncbi:MAG: tetratricopeptide repeat protein [Candidatus Cloacimonetes bacterium]|nr:tetratricopeptide repeat protein [Candidatus Cloacimonadota bacterium]
MKKVKGKERIEILLKLSREYQTNIPEKTVEYGHWALEITRELNYQKEEAQALNNIGVGYYYLGDYDKTLEYYSRSLQIAEQIKYKKGISNCVNNMAIIYNSRGNYDKALEYYQRSLEIDQELGDRKGVASTLLGIGMAYYDLSNYEKALDYSLNSLKIREEINDEQGITLSLQGIGIIYKALGDYEKALECHQKSLKIREALGDREGFANSLEGIGNIYYIRLDHEKALEYYKKSLKIREEIGDKFGVSFSLNNIGAVYNSSGNHKKALEYYQKSLEIRKEMDYKRGIAHSLNNIGNVYKDSGNYDKALNYYNESIILAKELNLKDIIQVSYEYSSEIYSLKGDYKKALKYFKLYFEVKDSIFTDESSEKIAEMQTKYETEKKEKENEILKKDNEIQKLEINKQQNLRNSFIVISILILFLAFVIYIRYRSKQKTNIILNQKSTEIENANSELNRKNKQITKQKNQLSRTLKELRETQKMLTDTAHRAGMAEIATGILHNVGNVLNSVKVSSQVLTEKIKLSKVNNLQKVLSLMEEHTDNLGEFITSDEKGKMLPEYLVKVGTTLKDEQDNSLKELSTLHKGINHIEEIIAVQQSYAGVSGLVEKIALSEMMDDVLKMHTEMFRKYKIKITKKYSKTKPILIEKGKLIQVFVNLLKNAKESLEIKGGKNKLIRINISEDKVSQIVEIIDNGIGINKNNLEKIFSYGFTSKEGSKGFGLHTSALTMNELKGKLIAHSDGEDKGAKFIVIVTTKNIVNNEKFDGN